MHSPAWPLASCVPGVFALVVYAVNFQDPKQAGILCYLFWPMLVLGVLIGLRFVTIDRRRYSTTGRPWYVSLAIAAHVIVLMVGIPFVLLLSWAVLMGMPLHT